jgi:hypothetical protein
MDISCLLSTLVLAQSTSCKVPGSEISITERLSIILHIAKNDGMTMISHFLRALAVIAVTAVTHTPLNG